MSTIVAGNNLRLFSRNQLFVAVCLVPALGGALLFYLNQRRLGGNDPKQFLFWGIIGTFFNFIATTVYEFTPIIVIATFGCITFLWFDLAQEASVREQMANGAQQESWMNALIICLISLLTVKFFLTLLDQLNIAPYIFM